MASPRVSFGVTKAAKHRAFFLPEPIAAVRPFVVWFVVALVVRLLYLMEQQATSVLFYQQMLDEEEMRRSAEALLAGAGFGAEPLFKAPLYPIMLAGVMMLTGDAWPFAMRLLQHVGGALLALIAADTAARLLAPGRARTIAMHVAAALVAFTAPLVRLEHQLLLDFPAVFFQSAMMWALVRALTTTQPVGAGMGALLRWMQRNGLAGDGLGPSRAMWLWRAGLLAALAWLTRPTITPVLPLLAVALLVVHESLRRHPARALTRVGIFLAAPLLAVGLVAARNQAVSGQPLWLPWQGGYNFYEANKRGAHGRYLEQGEFAVSTSGNPTYTIMMGEFDAAIARGDVPEPEADDYHGALDRWWRGRALADIKADPGQWLGLYVRKLLYLLNDREIYNIEVFEVQRRESPVLTYATPITFGMIAPGAFAALAFWPIASRGRRRALLLLAVYAAALAAAIALYYASGRLRAPLHFPAAIFAGIAVGHFATTINAATTRRGVAVALLIVGAIVAWGDWWGVRSERLDSIEFERLSNAAWRDGQHERALDYADRAAAALADAGRPPSPSLPILRAQALFGLGRIDDAATEFERAAAAQPRDPIAPFNRGLIALFHRHDAADALPWLDQALVRREAYHRARAVHGIALVKLGRLDEAESQLVAVSSQTTPPAEADWLRVALACTRRDRTAAAGAADMMRQQRGDAALATMADRLGPLGLDECLRQP